MRKIQKVSSNFNKANKESAFFFYFFFGKKREKKRTPHPSLLYKLSLCRNNQVYNWLFITLKNPFVAIFFLASPILGRRLVLVVVFLLMLFPYHYSPHRNGFTFLISLSACGWQKKPVFFNNIIVMTFFFCI